MFILTEEHYGQQVIIAVLDAVMATIFKPDLPDAVAWQLVRAEVITGLTQVVMERLAHSGLDQKAMQALQQALENKLRYAANDPNTLFKTEASEALTAVQDLHRARAQVEPDHPVHIYLIQAQLAAFRNYEVAYTKCYGDTPPADDPAQQVAAWNLWDLQEILQKMPAPIISARTVNDGSPDGKPDTP